MKRIESVADLGAQIREIREHRGWTHADAAAWLGVGARFLFDLEHGKRTVQMDLALRVAAKLGLRLAFGGPGSSTGSLLPLLTQTPSPLEAPAGHPAPRAWVTLRYAALSMARNCDLNVVGASVVRRLEPLHGSFVQIHRERAEAPGQRIGTLMDWCRNSGVAFGPNSPLARTGDSIKEEGGGPGFSHIIALSRAHARNTLLATEQLVRWLVFSTMIADTEIDIDCVRVTWSEAHPQEFELLPFERTMCFASGVSEIPYCGLRVGAAWNDGGLRADQWARFARDVVGVHPKLIFQMMQIMGVRVPGLLDAALLELLGAPPTSKPVIDAVREVRKRAERMMELMILAKPSVSGLATKKPLATQPVPLKLRVAPPKRLFNPNVGDFDD
jgi:transcriptional regulator with XRE-family HTH domain